MLKPMKWSTMLESLYTGLCGQQTAYGDYAILINFPLFHENNFSQ